MAATPPKLGRCRRASGVWYSRGGRDDGGGTELPDELTDDQWAMVEPLLPPAKPGGRPRTVGLRLVLNTAFYLNKSGCQWAMLPVGVAARSTAFDYVAAGKADGTWRAVNDALRRQVRVRTGRDAEPSRAANDSRTTKGSGAGGPRGYDGAKQVVGSKRHVAVVVVVDTLGLLLAVLVTAANPDDGTAARGVPARLTAATPGRLGEVCGDGKYDSRVPDKYLAESEAPYTVTVVGRPAGVKGLVLLRYRWVVERTHAWFGECRRNARDYERTTTSAEAMLVVSSIHLTLGRLAPDPAERRAAFTYPRTPMAKAA